MDLIELQRLGPRKRAWISLIFGNVFSIAAVNLCALRHNSTFFTSVALVVCALAAPGRRLMHPGQAELGSSNLDAHNSL